jgi:capsular polysaccharide biosynthesis protein
VSPNPLRVFSAGGVLSLLVAFAAVSLIDIRKGTIVERWQVERTLNMPVLGEIGRR